MEKTHRIFTQNEVVSAVVNELLREAGLDPLVHDVDSRAAFRMVGGAVVLSIVVDSVRKRPELEPLQPPLPPLSMGKTTS